jgi:hypothetical protein
VNILPHRAIGVADVIKLRSLRCGEDLGLYRWTHLIMWIFKMESLSQLWPEVDMTMEEASERCSVVTLKLEKEGHESKNVSGL